jgi:nucleotide-binding universal stress UspA family protein
MSEQRNCIVVGVVVGQSPAVVEQAAYFAKHFDADIVCATVDSSRYVTEERADGTLVTQAIDPDLVDPREERIDPQLEKQLAGILDGRGIPWSVRALAGDPATALGHCADLLDASMIVVGTRKSGMRRLVHEFFDGSVGARLAHRQHRPVVVIPLSPVSKDSDLPWAPRE